MTTLSRRARHAGIAVTKQRRSGHLRFEAPDGKGVTFASLRPGSSAAVDAAEVRLRKLGLNSAPQKGERRRVLRDEGSVLGYVSSLPGPADTAEISLALGWPEVDVSRSLASLARRIPNLTHDGTRWSWQAKAPSAQRVEVYLEGHPGQHHYTDIAKRLAQPADVVRDALSDMQAAGTALPVTGHKGFFMSPAKTAEVAVPLPTVGRGESPGHDAVKFLYEHPGQHLEADIAAAIGRDKKKVAGSLRYLVKNWPVRSAGGGYWYYEHEVRDDGPAPATARAKDNGGGTEGQLIYLTGPGRRSRTASRGRGGSASTRSRRVSAAHAAGPTDQASTGAAPGGSPSPGAGNGAGPVEGHEKVQVRRPMLHLTIVGSSSQGLLCKSGDDYFLVNQFLLQP